MCGTERDLFRLGKKIIRVAIEHHLADGHDRDKFFRDQFGGIEDVKGEPLRLCLGEDLHAQFVFGKFSGFDRFPQIPPVEVGIRT